MDRSLRACVLTAWTSGLIGLSLAACRWSNTQPPDSSPTSAEERLTCSTLTAQLQIVAWQEFAKLNSNLCFLCCWIEKKKKKQQSKGNPSSERNLLLSASSGEAAWRSEWFLPDTAVKPGLMKAVLIPDSIPEKCTRIPPCMKVVGPQGHRVLCWQSPSVPYASVPVIISTVTPIVMAKMPLSGYFPAWKLCYLYTFGFSEGEVWTFSFSMCESDPRNWEQNVLTFSSSSRCAAWHFHLTQSSGQTSSLLSDWHTQLSEH